MEKPIYNRIKSAIAEAGVTNKQVAEKIGRTHTSVSRYCSNDQQPTIEVLFEIADFLGVFAGDLLVHKKIQFSSPKK